MAVLFSDFALGKKLYCEQIAPLIHERAEATRRLIRDEIDPELVNLVIFGAFFAIAMDRAFTGKTEDLATVARQITDLVAFGFSPERKTRQRKRNTSRSSGDKDAETA